MKNKGIYIKVTNSERENIKSLAKGNKMSLSEYILHNALGNKSPTQKKNIAIEINKMQMRNFKVENNINQIAKRVNSNKNLSKSDLEKFEIQHNLYKELIIEQNNIINKIIKILTL